jgi:ribosomal-protein-alanine N-acetyltransferase
MVFKESSADGYLFRELTPEALPLVIALEKRCFSTPWSGELYRRLLAAGRCRLFGVFRKDFLAAYLAVAMLPATGELEVYNIAVDAAARRRGLARKLLARVLALAAESGLETALLEVRRNNAPAIRLYEALGFVPTGVRPRYYQDTGEDALIYSLSLGNAASRS